MKGILSLCVYPDLLCAMKLADEPNGKFEFLLDSVKFYMLFLPDPVNKLIYRWKQCLI